MQHSDLAEYRDGLKSLLANNGLDGQDDKIVIIEAKNRSIDRIIRARGIEFSDGAVFHFTERVALARGEVVRKKYSYHFQNGSFFFRYDKDSLAATTQPYAHAEHHLHVSGPGHEDLRYITHAATFEQVLIFILANFYS